MAALFLGRQLVLEVDARGAGLDVGLGDLENVQGSAEAGLGVGDDGGEPVTAGAALGMFDLIRALKGAVDLPDKFRSGVGRVEALVRIHGARGVGVRRHLPAGKIDCFQTGADLLHGLVAGHGAEGNHVVPLVEQFPQTVGAPFGEGMPDLDRTSEAGDIGRAIGPFDTVIAAFRRVLDELFE